MPDLFDKLVARGWLDRKDLLWWDLDYREKRKLVPFSEFKKRLVPVGFGKYVYSARHIPVTIHNVTIEGMRIPLFITVRPFTKRELKQDNVWPRISSIGKLKMAIKADMKVLPPGSVSSVSTDFFGHVRGIVREVRGKQISWYPIRNKEFNDKIWSALNKEGFKFSVPIFSAQRDTIIEGRSERVQKEIKPKKNISRAKERYIEFPEKEFVSHADFIKMVNSWTKKPLISIVPVRVAGFKETFPLVMRLNPEKSARPEVLGLFKRGGEKFMVIAPIKRESFATKINSNLFRKTGMKPVTQINFQGRWKQIRKLH